MNAAFFSPKPRSASTAPPDLGAINRQRARCIHRWVAAVFTLTVIANFAVMPWGPPPSWVTYAPLPPLLFLMITGLTMLLSSWIDQSRARRANAKGN